MNVPILLDNSNKVENIVGNIILRELHPRYNHLIELIKAGGVLFIPQLLANKDGDLKIVAFGLSPKVNYELSGAHPSVKQDTINELERTKCHIDEIIKNLRADD